MMDQSGAAAAQRSGGEQVRMGVTTLIAGEGGTPVPADQVASYFASLEKSGMSVNFGTYSARHRRAWPSSATNGASRRRRSLRA
jgi:N-acyl-D-amino-acid deacylase